jgi:hypothetical protein
MNVKAEWLKGVQERIDQRASELDYTTAKGNALLSEHLNARSQLDLLRNDFEFLSRVRTNVDFCKHSDMRASWLDAVERVYDLFLYFCPVAKATADEVFRRADRNGTNRNFALLNIGHHMNNTELQNNSYRQLEKIALCIPRRNSWGHPDGSAGWRSKFNELLAVQLRRITELDPMTTFEHMLDNRFAYIHKAAEFAFRDELRQIYRRPDTRPDLKIALDAISVAMATPPSAEECERERLATITLVEMAANETEHPGTSGVLHTAAGMLRDHPDLLAEKDQRQIRAEVVKAVARRRGVSERQVRYDIQRLEADVNNKNLRILRERLQEYAGGRLGVCTSIPCSESGEER